MTLREMREKLSPLREEEYFFFYNKQLLERLSETLNGSRKAKLIRQQPLAQRRQKPAG